MASPLNCATRSIEDLPPELLEGIFLNVVSPSCEPPIIVPYSPHLRSPASPYSISQVSRKWREIVLNFPTLWTHPFVKIPKEESIVHFLEEWLFRAGSLPLHLTLHSDVECPNLAATKAVLALFLNHLHKCIHFELDIRGLFCKIDPASFNLQLAHRARQDLLETIIVRGCEEYGSPHAQSLLNFLLDAPRLRSVEWSSGIYHWWPVEPGQDARSWGNLKTLTLSNMQQFLDPLRFALSCFPNLERLTITGTIHEGFVNFPTNSWPWLTYLSAVVEEPVSLHDVIIAPSLKELDIVTIESSAWRCVTGLLQRSAAKLEVLRAHCVTEEHNDPDLLEVLKSPYLQDLRVLEIKYPMGMDIVEFLTLPHCPATSSRGEGRPHLGASPELGCPLPHLENLSLLVKVPRAEDLVGLSKLVESRLGCPDPTAIQEWSETVKVVKLSLEITQR